MKKHSIAIDLDATLNNFDDEWMKRYNELWEDNMTPEDLHTWDTHTIVKPECGEKVYDIFLQPGFFNSLELKDSYIMETLDMLAKYYELYIVTAYHPLNCLEKYNWITEKLPMVNNKHIIFCNPKYLIGTDYLIDDGPHNIKAFKQKGLLVDAPYNQYLKDQYPRFKDWLEIKKYFMKKIAAGNL